MTPLVVGTREDVAGFALAGIEGVVCATREEADEAIARAGVDRLVFVSDELAVGGWRLAVGQNELAVGGWRLAVGHPPPTAPSPGGPLPPPTASHQPPTRPDASLLPPTANRQPPTRLIVVLPSRS